MLGRVAVKAATLLRGKEKPIFTSHVDTGDFVIVINAEKVRVPGKKEEQKEYRSFSGTSAAIRAKPSRRVALADRNCSSSVPSGVRSHNRLGRATFTKLKVYRGDKHPHAAQSPVAVTAIK